MKKYMMVTPETLNKLGRCFCGEDEVTTFISQMDEFVNELAFSIEMRKRIQEEIGGIILLKQVCIFTLFCREHMDLLHQLVKNLEFKEISEEEMNKQMENNG